MVISDECEDVTESDEVRVTSSLPPVAEDDDDEDDDSPLDETIDTVII